ncbi:glycosyltransferase family 4 protein [Ectobacillus funiculus]|uniref:glycosyltransferase family 4 protein n=1 Tax=Ectobacillus funiculus TaxID=137993 RepID=UPI00101D61C4|nr:glycosyltransferase family 4 protein [Ectobacillus funiculus]
MKKILFLHSSSELYGSDRSLLNLIKNIDRNRFGITVILPEYGPLVDELKKIDNIEVLIKDIATLRRKHLSVKGLIEYTTNFLNSLFYLINIIRKKKIDVVYTNTSVVFPGGIAAKLLGRKSIWHIREIVANKFEATVVSRIVNLFSDIIIANSKATASAISQNEDKLKVVYNAIESTQKKIVNNRLTAKDEIVIGMAGRINRWKGQKLFVDMAEKVLRENKTVQFVIAGDVYKGEDHILDDLKTYIKNKNLESKIKLLGQVQDMDSFYNNIDIFILPSIQPEPFGLVVLEAMERGIPVIATNHGGPVEIIENNVDGFLVDYVEASEMSNVALRLTSDSDLRKNVGQKGKEKRNNVFNLENYVKNISEIITEL